MPNSEKEIKLLNNDEIHEVAKAYGVRIWEIAKRVHIDESTLSRWFRNKLTGDRQKRVCIALYQLIEAKQKALSDKVGNFGE